MDVTRDVVLPLSPAEAWELLTDPDELATWLGSVASDPFEGDHAAGDPAVVRELDGTLRRLVVDEVVAGERIGFTWWVDGEPDRASHVALVLEADDLGCRVTVTESAPVRASVAGSVRRLAIGAGWQDRLVDLELRALTRALVLV